MHKNLDSVAAAKLLKTLRALEVAVLRLWVVRHRFLFGLLE